MSWIDRVNQKVMSALGRGRITHVDDTGPVQTVQVRTSAAELLEAIPRVQEFGFASVPPAGSDAMVVFLHGNRSQGVVVATNNQTLRIRELASGDAAIYDGHGHSIVLSASGITVNGNVTVNGSITATGNVTGQGTSLHTHTHGGVQTGGGHTGQPD